MLDLVIAGSCYTVSRKQYCAVKYVGRFQGTEYKNSAYLYITLEGNVYILTN